MLKLKQVGMNMLCIVCTSWSMLITYTCSFIFSLGEEDISYIMITKGDSSNKSYIGLLEDMTNLHKTNDIYVPVAKVKIGRKSFNHASLSRKRCNQRSSE